MAAPVTYKKQVPQANTPQEEGPQFDYQYPNPYAHEQDPNLPPGSVNEFKEFGPNWVQHYGDVYPVRRSSRWSNTRQLFWKPDGSLDEAKQAEYDSDKVASMWEPGDPTFFSGNPEKDAQEYADYMYSKVDKKLSKSDFDRISSLAKDYEKRMKAGDPDVANITDPQKAAKDYFYNNLYRRDIPSYKQYVNRYYKKPEAVKENPPAPAAKPAPEYAPSSVEKPMPEGGAPISSNPSKKRVSVDRIKTNPGRPTGDAKVRVRRYNDNFSGRPGPQNRSSGPRVVRRKSN